jgi:sulfur-carrier protein
MHVTVYVPAALRQFSGGAGKLRIELEHPGTLAAVLEALHADYPGVVERALDEQGRVREHVNIFVDGDSIRADASQGLQTPVSAGAEVWILPAVSGG